MCYRLAVASGLRYSEMGTIKPESFDWHASPATVTVKAAYAKNGQTATLPIPDDLAADYAYLSDKPPGKPISHSRTTKGAAMVQVDLDASASPTKTLRSVLRLPFAPLRAGDAGRRRRSFSRGSFRR